jgi:hypothetical protein
MYEGGDTGDCLEAACRNDNSIAEAVPMLESIVQKIGRTDDNGVVVGIDVTIEDAGARFG